MKPTYNDLWFALFDLVASVKRAKDESATSLGSDLDDKVEACQAILRRARS